ncbi:MAG TPA: integration host factor, actinobacterial type [Jatrophihabitans sp.]|nr:integration host factor, actinobacterial type [Jatrophihabitans sp.]
MPQAPTLSAEQRAQALRRAAAVRADRSRARADLKAGRLSLTGLLDRASSEEALASMRVSALLAALPGHGKVRAAALLDELGIASTRRVRGLGARQRAALLARVEQAAQSQP